MSNRLTLLMLSLIVCAPVHALPSVPAPVAKVIAAQHLPPNSVSFVIVDPDSGRVMAGENIDTPRSPASTIKLVTTFASLDELGPAYVWHTRALVRGAVKNGVLDGDLVLQGGGDPYMTLERWWSFTRTLRDKGLKAIHGDIVIDDTAFALPPEDPGAFDGRPNRSYNVVPNALMVNFQSIDFRVVADAATQRVEIVATPAPPNLVVENHVARLPVWISRWHPTAGIASCFPGRSARPVRSDPSHACCSGPRTTLLVRSSNFGASWEASSTESYALQPRHPMHNPTWFTIRSPWGRSSD
jgi:D-alanyl-D-alanine carboxypeptidase/D-alanyl-D-alanine-endopeptidase (penicillin-binding protein 4)